jgi:hypothetical protein
VEKSVTVPGKCYAISDGDRQDDPIKKQQSTNDGSIKGERWLARER